MQLPDTVESCSLNELREVAARQQKQLEQQQQLLVAKEQRLRYLRQQELRQQHLASENDRLRQLRERVEAQESKLMKLRTVQGQTLQQQKSNSSLNSELESLKKLFSEKEHELSIAARRADELSTQLDRLRQGQYDGVLGQPGLVAALTQPNAVVELEKLKRDLQMRSQLNEDQSVKLAHYYDILHHKQHDVVAMDARISELKQRLHRKKQLQLERQRKQRVGPQGGGTVTSRSNIRGGSMDNTHVNGASPLQQQQPIMKQDPKYQTLPHSIKFPPNIEGDRLEPVPGIAREVTPGEGQAVFGARQELLRTSSVPSQSRASATAPGAKSVNLLANFGPKPYSGGEQGGYTGSGRSHGDVQMQESPARPQEESLSTTIATFVESPSFIGAQTSTPVSHGESADSIRLTDGNKTQPHPSTPTGKGGIGKAASVHPPPVPSPKSNPAVPQPVTSQHRVTFGGPISSQQTAPDSSSNPGPAAPVSRLGPQPYKPFRGGSQSFPITSQVPTHQKVQGTVSGGPQGQVLSEQPVTTTAPGGKVPIQYHHTRLRNQPPPYGYHQRVVQQQDGSGSPRGHSTAQGSPRSQPTLPGSPRGQPAGQMNSVRNVESPQPVNAAQEVLATDQMVTDTKSTAAGDANKSYPQYAPRSVILNTYMRKFKPEALDAYRKNMQEMYKDLPPISIEEKSRDPTKSEEVKPGGTESHDGPVVYNIDPEVSRLSHHGPRPLRRRLSSSSDTSLEIQKHEGKSSSPVGAQTMSPQATGQPAATEADRKMDRAKESTHGIEHSSAGEAVEAKLDQGSVSLEVISMDTIHQDDDPANQSIGSHVGAAHAYEESVTEFSSHNDSIPFADDDVSSVKESPVRKRPHGQQTDTAKKSRRVSFDPLALLLDAALEGEYDTAVKSAQEVADPSRPNDEGITALHNAICAGHYDIVKFLVEYGCDVNSPDSDGWTPLHCAASCNNLPMVQLLVEHGAALYTATLSDQEIALEKCEEEEPGYQGCSQYLSSVQEGLGISNNGLAYAAFNFDAENPDELTVEINDKLRVMTRDDPSEQDWWMCQKGDQQGYVPSNMIAAYPRLIPAWIANIKAEV